MEDPTEAATHLFDRLDNEHLISGARAAQKSRSMQELHKLDKLQEYEDRVVRIKQGLMEDKCRVIF
jgi:hypothetical protein